MIVLGLFNLLILITPPITAADYSSGMLLHDAFSLTCHQLAIRSYCYYPADSSISDCPQLYSKEAVFETELGPAHKFPVCARCLFIYLAAFAGGIVIYFTKWRDSKATPNPIYFVLVLIPFALDGGSQFIGLRESTNELRALTGIIAGIAFSFYFIPMLNAFFLKDTNKENKEEAKEEKKKKKKNK